jgi:hypothetical protein
MCVVIRSQPRHQGLDWSAQREAGSGGWRRLHWAGDGGEPGAPRHQNNPGGNAAPGMYIMCLLQSQMLPCGVYICIWWM